MWGSVCWDDPSWRPVSDFSSTDDPVKQEGRGRRERALRGKTHATHQDRNTTDRQTLLYAKADMGATSPPPEDSRRKGQRKIK